MKKLFPYILIFSLFLPTLSLEFPIVLPKFARAAVLTKAPNNLGLVGYWSLNDGVGTKAGDSSGNGNTGTITGATWTDGKHGKALSFANTGYVSLGSATACSVATKTISFWAKPTATETYDMIFSNQTGNYYITFSSGNNLFVSYIDATPTQRAFVLASGIVSIGTWAHYTVTFQVSGNNVIISAYKNGSFVNSVTHTDGYSTSIGSSFLIGAFTSSGNTYSFQGALDDLRVYNRALTAPQVSALYGAGAVKRTGVSNQGLVGYWSMNDGAGTKAGDSSGNGNTGTITGATWVNGKRGKALNFDGNGDYVSFSAISTAKTQEGWFYFTQLATVKGNNNTLFSNLYQHSANNFLYFTLGADYFNWVPLVNTWYHLVLTYTDRTDSSTAKLYVNGVSYNITQQPASHNIDSINGISGGGTGAFSGLIDDVRIYNRALSPTEVSALYRQGEATINSSQNNKLTSGLVGLWSFNGKDISGATAYDRSPTGGNNGTITGATKTIGKVGQALSFDGSSNRVTTTLNSQLNDFTVSVWFKDDGVIQTYERLVDKNYVSGFWLGRNGATANSWGGGILESAGPYGIFGTFTDGVWNHLVSVRSGTSHILYANGVKVNENTVSASALDSTVVEIGNGTTGQAGGMVIDEVRIYSRALSASEIKQLYSMGK